MEILFKDELSLGIDRRTKFSAASQIFGTFVRRSSVRKVAKFPVFHEVFLSPRYQTSYSQTDIKIELSSTHSSLSPYVRRNLCPLQLRYTPKGRSSCKEGSVFDPVIGTCSRKNILEIRGIRDVYNPDYANTSSVAFKEMAYTKEYQLWDESNQQPPCHRRYQEGIVARPSSVVLEAFEMFEKTMKTPASITRVLNVLQIKQGLLLLFIIVIGR